MDWNSEVTLKPMPATTIKFGLLNFLGYTDICCLYLLQCDITHHLEKEWQLIIFLKGLITLRYNFKNRISMNLACPEICGRCLFRRRSLINLLKEHIFTVWLCLSPIPDHKFLEANKFTFTSSTKSVLGRVLLVNLAPWNT